MDSLLDKFARVFASATRELYAAGTVRCHSATRFLSQIALRLARRYIEREAWSRPTCSDRHEGRKAMLSIKLSRLLTSAIAAAVLVSISLMNYSFTAAHTSFNSSSSSSSSVVRIRPRAAERPADGSGPLAVTPALDTARAVSATVTSDGGTLTATAANGAVFTLTIPAGAIPEEETITMTPIASIPDLPFSGGLAGAGAVQLEPEGLLLLKAATLVIQPSSLLSLDQQCPFSWHQAGDDFHLF